MKLNNTYTLSRALPHVVLGCLKYTTRMPYTALYVTKMSGPNYFLTNSTFILGESIKREQLDSVTGISIKCKTA